MSVARRGTTCLVVLAVLLSWACRRSPARPRAPRLVLLYATCTLNRNQLAPYAPGVTWTPNLAALAREAVVFRRHQTETDQSGPAFASIFSGAQADRHGVYRHPAILDDGLYLAAEAFADQGYETHFWSGHPMASAQLNYGQGVSPDHVHARRPPTVDLYRLTANDDEFAAIVARVKADPSYRAFVQVNFTITHGPYAGADPRAVVGFRRENPDAWPPLSDAEILRWARLYEANYLRLQWDFPAMTRELKLTPEDIAKLASVVELYYRVGVRLLDHCLGRLIDSLRTAGVLEESLIAFTSDHGETLYRENTLFKWTHGGETDPDALQVPLIVRLPDGRAGVYEGVSRSIDVYPTLAGLAGFAVPAGRGVDGADLSEAVLGLRPPPVLRAFSHGTALGPELVQQYRGWLVTRYYPGTGVDLIWTAVRDGDTYARLRRLEDGSWKVQAYDLARDAGAAHDVFDAGNRRHRDLARDLEAYKKLLLAAHDQRRRATTLHEDEARERLRALGYIQ
jgi:arylsulfatase A-like enzyme